MTVLIVEDDEGIAKFLVRGLNEEGYGTFLTSKGLDALSEIKLNRSTVELIILDLTLPDVDGIELLIQIRKLDKSIPIIISSARGRVDDKVKGLDAGANDYLAKPYALQELLARIRALLRSKSQAGSSEFVSGNFRFDLLTKTAWRDTKRVELTQREWSLLEYFLRHPNQVLTRSQIQNEIWDLDFEIGSNVVDVYIGYLRRKLDILGEKSMFQSVRGAGYRFIPPGG